MLCVSIYIYYIPASMILMLATFTAEFIEDKKKIKSAIITFLISTGMAILLIYILGGFTSNGYESDGIDYYNTNINTFLNPQGYSTFLPRLATATDGEYEAFRIPRIWNNFTWRIRGYTAYYKKRFQKL